MQKRLKAGLIGFGRMGRGFAAAMRQSESWEIAAVCDIEADARRQAEQFAPNAKILSDPHSIFGDKSIEVVGLFTLADARPAQLRSALASHKQVIAEKPLAADAKTEWALVKEIEASNSLVAVNLFNRNAWYHKEMQTFIADGEIGDLAIIRVCHMTPGHMPTEGHEPEGPPFHDCGMHYIDVARWYAHSEFDKWHAQGIRIWDHTDPWWVQVHGTFKNGVVFDVTQGFVYGHLAAEKIHNCYVEAIGTKGVCRMRHNFIDATIELHGIHATVKKTGPFNDKKLDVMIEVFARSVAAQKNLGFPTARDAVIASEVSWAMLNQAIANGPPVVGSKKDLQQILQHRRSLRSGYGLPLRPQDLPGEPLCAGQPTIACGEELCGMQEMQKARAQEAANKASIIPQ
jgi:myo-inositol 2-dehydrogenase/D-chiro-inositol 1-dehydrogenase